MLDNIKNEELKDLCVAIVDASNGLTAAQEQIADNFNKDVKAIQNYFKANKVFNFSYSWDTSTGDMGVPTIEVGLYWSNSDGKIYHWCDCIEEESVPLLGCTMPTRLMCKKHFKDFLAHGLNDLTILAEL